MSLNDLPEDLPVPMDDGAADHLFQMPLPDLTLNTTEGDAINLGRVPGLVVIYIYPMTGRPDTPLPEGWNEIPGARGCTPQSCSFRDHFAELKQYNAGVFGISCQTSEYQNEARERLHLPFELLSDSSLKLKSSLNLPTFLVDGMELYHRMALIARDGIIEKVFYPVFPPDSNAQEVLDWLDANT